MSQFIFSPANALTLGQAQALRQGTRYDVDLSYVPNYRLGTGGIAQNWYPANYATADGEFSLRYEPANGFFWLRLRGADVIVADPGVYPTTFMGWQAAGNTIRTRLWAEPNAGARAVGFRFSVDGAFTLDRVVADAGAALSAPTAGHLLVGADGVTPLAGTTINWMWNDVVHETTSLDQWADTAWFGDSETAPLLATLDPSIPSMLTLQNGRRVMTFAQRGLGCDGESTLFGNSRFVFRDPRLTRALMAGLGINDVLANLTGAQCITKYQNLVNTVDTFVPNLQQWELCDMPPCNGALSAPQIVAYNLLQAAIRGQGPTPITSIHPIVHHSEMYNLLNDPNNPGSLNPIYESVLVDHLHYNMLARTGLAPLYTNALL